MTSAKTNERTSACHSSRKMFVRQLLGSLCQRLGSAVRVDFGAEPEQLTGGQVLKDVTAPVGLVEFRAGVGEVDGAVGGGDDVAAEDEWCAAVAGREGVETPAGAIASGRGVSDSPSRPAICSTLRQSSLKASGSSRAVLA